MTRGEIDLTRSEANKKHYYKDVERSRKNARERLKQPDQRAAQLRWRRETRKELRQSVLGKFGNKCGHCPENDPVVLQIDHVYGGGKQELKRYSGRHVTYLRKVLADTEGNYQLLCANCNIKKYRKGLAT